MPIMLAMLGADALVWGLLSGLEGRYKEQYRTWIEGPDGEVAGVV